MFQFEFRDGQAPGEWNPVRVEAVVSETFARRCFGSGDAAVGQSVLYGGTPLSTAVLRSGSAGWCGMCLSLR